MEDLAMNRTPMAATMIFGIAAAFLFFSNAHAQTVGGDQGGAAPAHGTGGFDALSYGNRKIAEALYGAQQAEDGDIPWSLDDIAAAKRAGTGWGNVFRRMKEDGLVEAGNLGQVVGGRGKAGPGSFLAPMRSNVVVTSANGRQVTVDLVHPRRRSAAFAEARSLGAAARGHGVKAARTSRLAGRPRSLAKFDSGLSAAGVARVSGEPRRNGGKIK